VGVDIPRVHAVKTPVAGPPTGREGRPAVVLDCTKCLNKDLAWGHVIFAGELLGERAYFQLPMRR